MKKKFKFLLVLIFFIPLLVYPCRCREATVTESVKYSDIILKGRVLSITKFKDYEEQGLRIDTTGLDDYSVKYKCFAPIYFVSVKIEKMDD